MFALTFNEKKRSLKVSFMAKLSVNRVVSKYICMLFKVPCISCGFSLYFSNTESSYTHCY